MNANLSGAVAAGCFKWHMLFILLGYHLVGVLAVRIGEHEFRQIVVQLGQVPTNRWRVVAVRQDI